MQRPLIAVTPWYDYEKGVTYIKDGYCEGIIEAGGLAFLLPAVAGEDLLDEAISRFDGFLISGGPDIDPAYYNEVNLPYNGSISPVRDQMEICIVKKAVLQGKPVFGICRGIQVMNVALGGTLYQDIQAQVKAENLLKHSQEAPKWFPTHEIFIEKDSRVWNSFMRDTVRVNSYHHQAVKDIAPGFKATSRSPDGIIESLELENHVFAVGVQWHPELMWRKNADFLRLFSDFVDSCKKL